MTGNLNDESIEDDHGIRFTNERQPPPAQES